jgi:hypothetical protein
MQKTSVFADFYCLPNKLALMGWNSGAGFYLQRLHASCTICTFKAQPHRIRSLCSSLWVGEYACWSLRPAPLHGCC